MSTPAAPPFFTAVLTPSGQQCDAWADQPLLVSMEMGGINWPSSCRNGSCRTCLCKMTLGRVRYEIEWPGLMPDEHAEGWILPCVAYPEGDVVLQDPDV